MDTNAGDGKRGDVLPPPLGGKLHRSVVGCQADKSGGSQAPYCRTVPFADIPRFDEHGLWSYDAVWFSRDGNLLATAERFVEEAEAGFTAGELQDWLNVEVKEPLLGLYRQRRIDREDIGGRYVYFSRDPAVGQGQRQRREARKAAIEIGDATVQAELSPELKAAIILFFSILDEQQRRLYAGLEAHKVGHGGDRRIAEFFGLDVHTVARGREELFGEQVQRQGVRKKGGGRKPAGKEA